MMCIAIGCGSSSQKPVEAPAPAPTATPAEQPISDPELERAVDQAQRFWMLEPNPIIGVIIAIGLERLDRLADARKLVVSLRSQELPERIVPTLEALEHRLARRANGLDRVEDPALRQSVIDAVARLVKRERQRDRY